jgi:hypothetical protein
MCDYAHRVLLPHTMATPRLILVNCFNHNWTLRQYGTDSKLHLEINSRRMISRVHARGQTGNEYHIRQILLSPQAETTRAVTTAKQKAAESIPAAV